VRARQNKTYDAQKQRAAYVTDGEQLWIFTVPGHSGRVRPALVGAARTNRRRERYNSFDGVYNRRRPTLPVVRLRVDLTASAGKRHRSPEPPPHLRIFSRWFRSYQVFLVRIKKSEDIQRKSFLPFVRLRRSDNINLFFS